MEKDKRKININIILLVVAIATIIGTCFFVININTNVKQETFSSSVLIKTIEMANLSTSQFTYNGIAEIPNEKNSEKIDCYIKYKAIVKVGVDFKKINIEKDDENKIVTISLPNIKITDISVDAASLSYIPSKPKYDLNTILQTCKNDVNVEVKNSDNLIKSAEENLKSVVEGLVEPIVTKEGYEIVWK